MTALFDHDIYSDDHSDRAAQDREALRVEAEKKAQERARERRNKLVRRVDVLDELLDGEVEFLAGSPSIADVAAFFDIGASALNRLLRMFPDEFALDGWSAPQVRGGKDRWTDRAIVRAALLLDEVPSAPAAEIRYRLDVAALPVAFSSREWRIGQCERLFAQAMAVVEDVHGESSPVDIWRRFQEMPRYELQALTVALAALVPDQVPGTGAFLRTIGGRQGRVAEGLAQLIPVRSNLHERRRRAGREPRSSEPGGVAVIARRGRRR
ncbi:hypothetical protein Y900_030140 [Mycolicibacterium aromaticivorans JS19b1 = JCM 16368]|uniref:Uncharacterized protein n=1 Tax=Mycolicibacterium aromaticivorans JS19b1 = JCM 16368 TaxID=1440774 RepID=A0A064CB50_9MYCO|nr:glutathione S-transferase domain-containing protein [Mycolicibacterium aromaticivorans]KDE96896.1 hypothetical protein Y900_030140 [Mycolicibacterium aromaticivorans JS19b1 = JCM 16368]